MVFSSCVSSQKLIRNSKYQAVTFSKQHLNGIYEFDRRLWNQFNRLSKTKNIITTDTLSNATLHLKVNDKNELSVEIYLDKNPLHKVILKGKPMENYFSLKRKFILVPFFPVLYFHRDLKILLGNDAEGNLIILYGGTNGGSIAFIGDVRSWKNSRTIFKVQ